MQLIKGKQPKALKICLYAPEGLGKTTFAAQMPNPVFIDTEGGSGFLDVTRTPRPTSWTMLLDQVRYFVDHPSELGTLVIDTLDWAEKLCIEQFCASKQIKGIEDMPYGKGYVYIAEEFGKLLNLFEELSQKGVHVFMTAHATLRKFEQPDELGSYDKWELKLSKKVAPLVKEFSDMLLFANYETYVVKESKNAKGKAQGGKRVMYTSHSPCWDAKNRQGLPDKLPFDFAQIAACLPGGDGTKLPVRQNAPEPEPERKQQERTPKRQPETVTDVGAEVEEALNEALPFYVGEGTGDKAGEDTGGQERTGPDGSAETVPKAVADLMESSQVSEADVRKVIAAKGYYTMDTPWDVMDREGFVEGWVLPFWSNIVEMIRSS